MKTTHERKTSLLVAARVGLFLALRDIRRANKWTTGLIVAVMVLTFLNLVVVSGILVGLIQGSIDAQKGRYSGELIVSTFPKKSYIEQSADIVSLLKTQPGVTAVAARYLESGSVETNYKNRRRPTDLPDRTSGLIAGIDPTQENKAIGLSRFIVEGSYLNPADYDQILIGANLLSKYAGFDSPDLRTLPNIEAGSRVRLRIGDITREVTIKGVLKSKVGEIDQRIFMVDSQLRGLIGRTDYNVDEIIARIDSPAHITAAKATLLANGVDTRANVRTFEEAQPKFLKDIVKTFALLGNMIGSIGLAVASITIFIVIFVNAITRRRYIGILKGIGVDERAIEISYVIQSLFYATSGMIIGSILIFGVLKPYVDLHPINFPFSDGVLVATAGGTALRAAILLVATLIAGFIPAKIVVKQNTLDAILGR